MARSSTDKLSYEYLTINCCGVERLYEADCGSTRPNGRVDYHFFYVTEGECFVTIDGRTQKVGAGNLVVYLPGQRQEYIFKKGTHSTTYYIHFSGTLCDKLFGDAGMNDRNIYYIGISSNIIKTFEALINEFHLKINLYEYISNGLLLNLISQIGRKISNSWLSDANLEKRIHEICEFIVSNKDKSLSVKEYAAMCNLSESRFSHIFKRVMGTSPVSYCLAAKVEAAKEMLIGSNMSIAQISEEAGFQEQNYFSRVFKKHTGLSPSKFRTMKKMEP